MIENEVQLNVTKSAIFALKKGIAIHIREGAVHIDPIIFIAMLQSLQSSIDEMEADIEEYFNQRIIAYGLGDPTLDNQEKV